MFDSNNDVAWRSLSPFQKHQTPLSILRLSLLMGRLMAVGADKSLLQYLLPWS